MGNDARQASGASGKAKRRLPEEEDGAKANGGGSGGAGGNAAEDYTAYPKRQRVSRACDSCRSKKDKCDGVQPVCSTCAALCRPCTYKSNPKKRGLPTGYIRTLELLWGLVFSRIQGSEDVVRALLRAANIPSHLASMGKEAEGADAVLASFKNSVVLRDIERMLTLLEQPEEDQDKGLLRGLGDSPLEPDSNAVALDRLEWRLPDVLGDATEDSVPPFLSPVKTPTSFTTKATQRTTTKDGSSQTLPPKSETHHDMGGPSQYHIDVSTSRKEDDPLHLPANAWPLLDVYFTYTQCWLPILEKHDILRTAFRYSEAAMRISPTNPGSGDHAALWAALTLASFQQLSITAIRQFTNLPETQANPFDLYEAAKSLIPLEDGAHEIGHVQALLILSLVKLGQQDWVAAWMLIGQAVRISQLLRLDDPSEFEAANRPHGRTNHVLSGCFVLETLVAMQTQQLPSLRKENMTKTGPVNEDGLEEWHPWEDQTGLQPGKSTREAFPRGPLHALSTFNRLVSLVSILNELCCLRQSSTTPMAQLERLERQLQLWITSLPKAYRVDLQTQPTKPASPHIFGLEMMYEGIVTTLGLQLATHEKKGVETPRKRRAIESSKRSLLLLQTYMETYSLSATCPTFGMILTFGIQQPRPRPEPTVELDFGLKQKLQSFSTHVASVWTGPDRHMMNRASSTLPDHRKSISHSTSLAPDPSQGQLGNHTALNPEHRMVNLDPFMPNQWLQTPASVEDPTFGTPTTSSLAKDPPPQIHETPQPSLPVSKPLMIPDLSTTNFQPTQPPTYDPNLSNLESFIDVDGYGPRQPKIAPDLDALFDELASLDGTEK